MKKRILAIWILMMSMIVVGCNNAEENTIVNNKEALSKNYVSSEKSEAEENKLSYENTEGFRSLNNSSDTDNIMNIIEELSSPKYEGRLTGTEGNKLAGDYIANYFENIGLKNFEDIKEYKHGYTQQTITLNSEPLFTVKNSKGEVVEELEFLKDFNTYTLFQKSTIKGEVQGEIHVIKSTKEMSNENKEIDDKILLIPKEVPVNSYFIMKELENTKGIIIEVDIENSRSEMKNFMKSVYTPQDFRNENEGPVILQCESGAFQRLVEYGEHSENSISLKVDYSSEDKPVDNIVGMIPGSDEKLKDEYIVFSAHFDHLGNNFNDTYNPGALDNCSGVATILEIARNLKDNNIQTKKSILFVAFNGEEEGLLGSDAFVSQYKEELKKAVNINLDMVGHINENPITVYYKGNTEVSKDIKKILENENVEYIEDRGGDRSDNGSFSKFGIPALTLIEWEMAEYHQYTDTIDKIEEADFTHILKVLYAYIYEKGM